MTRAIKKIGLIQTSPLPGDFSNNLRAIADDPYTPVKVKTEIEKWFYETVYGKATQGLELEGGSVEVRSLDLNKLSDEQLAAMMEEADE